jgi:ATP-dependent Clp protease ATP-binding subunit ClpB
MKQFLHERLIGQDEAIEEICSLFVARSVRTEDDKRPFLSVFLNGPSGVGKTLIFELIWEFLRENEKKRGFDIPVTKISLNGVFAFELVEIISWLTNSARNPGDSRKSKFEELFENSFEVDPIFARQVIILDEFDKLGPSLNWNDKTAFNSLEILDNAIITPKHVDGIPINLMNCCLVFTGNYFQNEIKDPTRTIGFAMDGESAPANPIEVSSEEKETVIGKIRKYFSISAFNRIDKFVIFNPTSGNMRQEFAENEVRNMFKTIDQFYHDRWNPLPDIEQFGTFESLVEEALSKSEPTGWFRAVKRYVQNSILGRILLQLHEVYPNLPKSSRERVITRGADRREDTNEFISKADIELMNIFEQREAIADMCASKD